MAARGPRKRRFTVEDVVSLVSTEESNSVASEPLSNSFSSVLSKALDEFDCLGASIEVERFKREARWSLDKLRIKCVLNPTPEGHLNILLWSRVCIGPILAKEVLFWVNLVSRRLRYKERIHNSWTIEFSRDFAKELFDAFRSGVNAGSTSFGISVDNGTVKYMDMRKIVRDFAKISGLSRTDIQSKWKKEFKGRRSGCKAELLCTEEKPFIITYSTKKMKVTISCNFGCWNQYGHSFHS